MCIDAQLATSAHTFRKVLAGHLQCVLEFSDAGSAFLKQLGRQGRSCGKEAAVDGQLAGLRALSPEVSV